MGDPEDGADSADGGASGPSGADGDADSEERSDADESVEESDGGPVDDGGDASTGDGTDGSSDDGSTGDGAGDSADADEPTEDGTGVSSDADESGEDEADDSAESASDGVEGDDADDGSSDGDGDGSQDGDADGESDDGVPVSVDPDEIGPVDDDGGTYAGEFPDMEEPDADSAVGDEEDIEDGVTDEEASDAEVAERLGEQSGGLFDAEVGNAPDDEEQPLEEHVQEMIYRFLAVAVAMGGVAVIALLWSDDLINFLWYSFLGPGAPLCPGGECPQTFRPHLYHPLSLVLARLKVAVLVGFVVALPVAVYQTYLFMRPGLYPRERRYYLAAVPTSLVLAAIGVAFAHFLVLPALFSYFMGYSTRAAEAALGLAETFNIIVIMLGFFALVFQIPLFVMLAIMMGVTTRRWLESRRLYFWMGFGGVAFIFSPDPTGMAPLLVALTMVGLFEGTLTLLRWTGKDSPILAPEPMRARRPYAWAFALLVGYAVSDLPLPTGYYDQLPPVVVETLADLGLTAATPLIVGVGIVAVFEIGFYLLRRLGAGLRLQLWFYRVRRPVWVGAVVVGYLASPEPVILDSLRATTLEPMVVGAVVLGIVVAYEIAVQLVVWRRG